MSLNPFDTLLARIEDRAARVGVIGLGYVGLPLTVTIARQGYPVTGFDIDPGKIVQLEARKSYIEAVTDADLADLAGSTRWTADFALLAEMDVIIICVPTPLTVHRDPDLSYVISTAEEIARHISSATLVVLESTTYPGTTVEVVSPILERSDHGLGNAIFIGFSPEREDPGNASYRTATIPKIVAGDGPEAGRLIAAFYGRVVDHIVPVSSTATAEAVKITENIFRSVNIALVNELKVIYDAMGIDIWEVIDAAATKPFGYMPFYPGPGLGGHCIPIDPFYLTWLARKYGMTTRFIELAGEINSKMPEYVISQLGEFLNDQGKPIKGSKILLLGAAYKKDVDDPRESPSFVLMELLIKRGAVLSYNDPHVPSLPKMRHHPTLPAMESTPLTAENLSKFDCVLISTDHSAYDPEFLVQHSKMVLDTRNLTKNVIDGREKIFKA